MANLLETSEELFAKQVETLEELRESTKRRLDQIVDEYRRQVDAIKATAGDFNLDAATIAKSASFCAVSQIEINSDYSAYVSLQVGNNSTLLATTDVKRGSYRALVLMFPVDAK